MDTRTKYPRTFHLPWSQGATDDDKVLQSTDHFVGKDIVITEKADGECATVYSDGYSHARSIDSKRHVSRDWVRTLAARLSSELPKGWRVCGESMLAQHSIGYDELPSFFLVFALYDDQNNCLSWDDTAAFAELMGLSMVPVLYRGPWDEAAVKACMTGVSKLGGAQEGYVARVSGGFAYEDFASSVAKYVRKGHVAPDTGHWFQKEMVPNKLKQA